jgi:hypothetical protein
MLMLQASCKGWSLRPEQRAYDPDACDDARAFARVGWKLGLGHGRLSGRGNR